MITIWVCDKCAKKLKSQKKAQYSTYHNGVCDICEQETPVTESRDYGNTRHLIEDHYDKIFSKKIKIIKVSLKDIFPWL